ncbi:MAG: hypothetical protein M0R33_17060 [Methylomonas sp.]|jgi:hypothetical protein|uniref:hypothetical protein n=1 Tax=Methylomonas sp. TaxID=418 RepID=UPI0025FEB38E|nr:hypothetical protein [Methylomonas sp.]MCK9608156.1 hypothetical protein [Methylomonas sp.]
MPRKAIIARDIAALKLIFDNLLQHHHIAEIIRCARVCRVWQNAVDSYFTTKKSAEILERIGQTIILTEDDGTAFSLDLLTAAPQKNEHLSLPTAPNVVRAIFNSDDTAMLFGEVACDAICSFFGRKFVVDAILRGLFASGDIPAIYNNIFSLKAVVSSSASCEIAHIPIYWICTCLNFLWWNKKLHQSHHETRQEVVIRAFADAVIRAGVVRVILPILAAFQDSRKWISNAFGSWIADFDARDIFVEILLNDCRSANVEECVHDNAALVGGESAARMEMIRRVCCGISRKSANRVPKRTLRLITAIIQLT